jgi:glutamate racemase
MKISIASIVFILLSFDVAAEDCNKLRHRDETYYISYLDSGIGGAIFAADSLKKITQNLRNYENEYAVEFKVKHYGDTANAPYGNKSAKEISELTFKMADYVLSKPSHRTNILACNTASANLENQHAKQLQEKYQNSGFITMVETSVNAISNQTPKNDLIAIFATPSTIRSGVYQEALQKNFSVITMNPKNWVRNIETAENDNKIKADFDLEMAAFVEQYGDKQIKQIKSVGLFCTHYPYFKQDIQKHLSAQGNNSVRIFSQGELFADNILNDVSKRLTKSYKKRARTLPKKCQSNKSFQIDSHISGNDPTALINAINKMYGEELKINVATGELFEATK